VGVEVSVIIPVGRDTAGLEITLRSIAQLKWEPSLVEVIVCNDGGGTAISEMITRFGCREAMLPENRGSYAARNRGIQMSQGRVIAFVDADEVVTDGWLAAGLEAIKHADYVGGRIVVDAGMTAPYWERVDAKFAFPVSKYLADRRYAPTANLFVRRKVFEELGGFDESLRSGGDWEFGVRVSVSNKVQRYCAEAVTIHPARDFRERLRKIRRTSQGDARLAVKIWGRSGFGYGARALLVAMAKVCQAAALALGWALVPANAAARDTRLLAAGHAAMGIAYNSSLAASSFAAAFQRRAFRRHVPVVEGRSYLAARDGER
jgi:glycosyltransferase involved in cell wall biosynthesis